MNWITIENAYELEDQVKFNIANVCEMMINALEDEEITITNAQATDYIYKELRKGFMVNDSVLTGKYAASHLRFYGKQKTLILIKEYLENYTNVQEYIK